MSIHGVPPGIVQPPEPVASEAEEAAEREHPRTTGTLILVFVFLAAFVVYYFVNWKLLSALWEIG